TGGAGGQGGGTSQAIFQTALLPSTVAVTFSNAATGGQGGAALTTIGLSNPGTAGSNVSFGSLLIAYGGGNPSPSAGGHGFNQTGTTGGAGGATGVGTAGTAQSSTTLGGSSYANTGGGGGGGSTTTAFAGAAGGANATGGSNTPFMTLNGGAAGAAGGGAGRKGHSNK